MHRFCMASGILRFLTFSRAMMLLFFGMCAFLGAPGYAHRALIAWQGTRFNWIFATIFSAVFGGLGMLMICREMRADQLAYRKANGLCLACGYDLAGNTSGVCPECGTLTSMGLTEVEHKD